MTGLAHARLPPDGFTMVQCRPCNWACSVLARGVWAGRFANLEALHRTQPEEQVKGSWKQGLLRLDSAELAFYQAIPARPES
jgi:hypothetical protein